MPNTQLQLIGELRLLYLQEKKEREYIQQVKENARLQLIKELCILYSQRERELKFIHREKQLLQQEKELKRHEKEILCFNFLNNLHHLYQQEKERVYNQHIRPFIEENSFLNKKTLLTYIGKEEEERYHSKLLAKLWNCQDNIGATLLADFLQMANVEKEWYQMIEKSSYMIIPEQPTGKQKENDSGQIDLFIKDETHKWLICIENKINSKVHANKRSGRSQLEIYEGYCKRTYSGYKQLYILLSHSNNKIYAQQQNGWKYVDYYAVMKSLLKYSQAHEIVRDYLKVLYSILFRSEEFNSQQYNKNTSLYTYSLFIHNVISKIY